MTQWPDGSLMRNICLFISYDGTDFHGWQRQPNLLTLQDCLESTIERVVGEKAQLYGSGRTDAGVHALNQVANFKTDCRIPCANLVHALNDALPPTVRINNAQEVPPQFHARYDVRSKTYRYRILQAPLNSPFLCRYVWHYPFPLNLERMAQAAKLLEGAHDFTSFAAVEGVAGQVSFTDEDAASPLLTGHAGLRGELAGARVPAAPARDAEANMVRTIFISRILRRTRTPMLIYEVTGNGFLHHMVRNVVGTLVEAGRGKLDPGEIMRILAARDRTMAGPTAPAQGLCLVRVEY
jgi:tRNA pseudouridine38-40 synthase